MIRYFLGTLIAAFLFISCNSSSSDNPPIIIKKETMEEKTTTFMVYLPGTDLESDDKNGTRNINAMMKASNSDKLNIVIQTGAANVTYDATDADKPVKDWKRVKRHKVTNNQIVQLQDLGISCITGVTTKDCYEMGTTDSLVAFIRDTITKYPADRYILSLWDHGGGPIGGYGSTGVRAMDMNEIIAAFEMVKNEVKFDIIGFDACLMGSLEIAYNLRHYGKYLLASEELEPGWGWNYQPPLDALAKNPNISNFELSKILIDEYIKYNGSSDKLTLSLVDMSKTPALVTALDNFAKKAIEVSATKAHENWLNLFMARSQTDEYSQDFAKKDFYNLIDIGDFTKTLKSTAFSDYNDTATALNNALKEAVMYNSTDSAHSDSTGLSIFFPYHFDGKPSVTLLKDYNSLFYNNKAASFSTSYRDMLNGLLAYAGDTIKNPTTLNIENAILQDQFFTSRTTSNFGIATAVMVVSKAPVDGKYKFFVSGIAGSPRSAIDTYSITARKSDNIIALNGTPVYMDGAEIHSKYSKTTYAFEIPAYVTPAPVQGEEAPVEEEAILTGTYDFSTNSGKIADTARPIDTNGRNDIKLEKGAVVRLADVVIDTTATDPARRKITTKSSVPPITLDDNEAHALKLAPISMASNDKLAFLVRNLKGEVKLSNFFDKNGTPSVRSMMSDDSDAFLQILADGLNQPIK